MSNLLAIIPARGGSKGLPRKNVLPVNGRPLIAWTILAAQSSRVIDRLVLSSDDLEIIEVARQWGCDVPFRRPDHISDDAASSIDVIIHAISQLDSYKYVALLQPTSPLRSTADIDDAFSLLLESGAPSCVSVCESAESPYLMHKRSDGGRLEGYLKPLLGVTRRQDLPKSYVLNGAVYIARVDWLLKKRTFISDETVGYVMPRERSIDIDEVADFEQFREIAQTENNAT